MKMFQVQFLPRRVTDQSGFALIELIVVLVIIAILSHVAVAKFSDTHVKIQYETMIKKIGSDVRYAQQLAMMEGMGTRLYIDVSNNRYYLKWADSTYIQNPMGGGDFIMQLGVGIFNGVTITETGFTNGGILDFDKSGTPLNGGGTFPGNLILVTLNDTKKILITGDTGLVTVEDL